MMVQLLAFANVEGDWEKLKKPGLNGIVSAIHLEKDVCSERHLGFSRCL